MNVTEQEHAWVPHLPGIIFGTMTGPDITLNQGRLEPIDVIISEGCSQRLDEAADHTRAHTPRSGSAILAFRPSTWPPRYKAAIIALVSSAARAFIKPNESAR